MTRTQYDTVHMYTDGACSQTGVFPGGAGVYITRDAGVVESFYSGDVQTTNNRMEMTAVAFALEYAAKNVEESTVNIYSDSAYIINCLNQGWYNSWTRNGWKTSKKEDVKNVDLWKRILKACDSAAKLNNTISFIKVKAHSTNVGNNKADALAVAARDRKELFDFTEVI